MKNLNFTREQVTNILEGIAKKEEGVQQILKISIEAIMRAERDVHNEQHQDVSNGYRIRRTYGHKKLLELKIQRSRHGNFRPLLLGLLSDQEEEACNLAPLPHEPFRQPAESSPELVLSCGSEGRKRKVAGKKIIRRVYVL